MKQMVRNYFSLPSMMSPSRRRPFLALVLALYAACLPTLSQAQPQAPAFDKSASNLMVVLRESPGKNKQDEVLVPVGKFSVPTKDGKSAEIEMAWYEYLGDMHIRFVFDGPNMMMNATPEDMRRLNRSPEAAIKLAVENLERVYGKPRATAFSGALMELSGLSPDLNSSYFLDRAFWDELARKNPEGIVAAPIKRGGLLYAPLSEREAVDGLRKAVGGLYESSGRMRVSSGLYLFKEGRWTVFQAPAGAPEAPAKN